MLRKLVLIFVAVRSLFSVAALSRAEAQARPPSRVSAIKTPGTFILAGGGHLDPAIRPCFIELAGGPKAKIVLIPSASSLPGIADSALASWEGENVRAVTVLDARSRDEANDPRFCAPLRKATGVWIGGGDQARLLALYGGTQVEAELHALLRRGGVVGGTSAGASCVSAVMIHGGGERQGFGLLPEIIVDQHFSRRQRLPRLRKLLEKHPDLAGIGIDEGTAAVIRDGRIGVLGRGKVWVSPEPATPAMKGPSGRSLMR
jgi:cyanophycinase